MRHIRSGTGKRGRGPAAQRGRGGRRERPGWLRDRPQGRWRWALGGSPGAPVNDLLSGAGHESHRQGIPLPRLARPHCLGDNAVAGGGVPKALHTTWVPPTCKLQGVEVWFGWLAEGGRFANQAIGNWSTSNHPSRDLKHLQTKKMVGRQSL